VLHHIQNLEKYMTKKYMTRKIQLIYIRILDLRKVSHERYLINEHYLCISNNLKKYTFSILNVFSVCNASDYIFFINCFSIIFLCAQVH